MEQTPLLSRRPSSEEKRTWRVFLQESTWLLENSRTTTLAYFLQLSLQLSPILCLGHLGTNELAAFALASVLAGLTGWSIAIGVATAMDSNHDGEEESQDIDTYLGIQFQKTLSALAILLVPVSFIWWNAAILLSILGQDNEIVALCGTFLRYMLIGAPAYFLFEALKKYCQAQGVVNGATRVMLVISPINAFLNYILIFKFKLGLVGAALATSITYWLLFISMAASIFLIDGKQVWTGWTIKAYSGYFTFLRSAAICVFMVCSEWWAFEILTLAASYLGIINLAAHSILMMIASSTFSLPFGVSESAARRIDYWLEYDEPTFARRSLQAAFFLSTMFGVIIIILYRLLAQSIAAAFTSQPDTANILIDILPWVGIFQLFEGISTVASAALRGLNRHQVGTYTTLLTYYCLIFPLAFLLSFAYDLSLSGLWYAMIAGFAVNSIGLLLYLKGTVDWNQEVELANNRECDEV